MTILCQGNFKKLTEKLIKLILYHQELFKKIQSLDTFGTQSVIQQLTMIYAHFYVGEKKSGGFNHFIYKEIMRSSNQGQIYLWDSKQTSNFNKSRM